MNVIQIIEKRIKDIKQNKDESAHGMDGAILNMIIVDELECLITSIKEKLK